MQISPGLYGCRLLLVLCILSGLLACELGQLKSTELADASQSPARDTFILAKPGGDFSKAMELNLEDAVVEFGNPPYRVRARLSDLMGEFYIGLDSAFTLEQKQSGDVRIHELTWEKDSINLITIWYHEQVDASVPVDYFIYDRRAEF